MADHPNADRPGDHQPVAGGPAGEPTAGEPTGGERTGGERAAEPMAHAGPEAPTGPDRGSDTTRKVLVPIFGLIALVLLAVALFSGSDADGPEAADGDAGTDQADGAEATAPDATDQDDAANDDGQPGSEVDGPGDDPAAVEGEPSAEEIEEMQQALRELERREDGDPLALGAVDAPVVMILWSDFQCPFCATFGRDTKPALVDRFVDDGTLRIEWRDYPLLGDASVTAALAGRAAAEQGAFWELHDEIFAEDRPQDSLDAEVLTAMAGDLGLDTERFAADLDDEELWSAVAADQALASQLGITGTPAFLVGGTPILGAQSEEVFAELIEELAQQG